MFSNYSRYCSLDRFRSERHSGKRAGAAIFWAFMTLATTPVFAQEIKVHLKEVHIVQPHTGPDHVESVLIRGLTHTGKKIQFRLNRVSTIDNGLQVRADCLRFSTLAIIDENSALEIYLTGMTISGGVVDGRGYKNAIVTAAAGNSVSCVLVNKNRFDYSIAPSSTWYDL